MSATRTVTVAVTAEDIATNPRTAIASAIQRATGASKVSMGVWLVGLAGQGRVYLPSRVASLDTDLQRGLVVAPFAFELRVGQ